MLSRRVPHAPETNLWWKALAARRAAGAELFDLTETNPTRVGLGGAGAREVAALGLPGGLRDDPDPRGLYAAREAVCSYYAARGLTAVPEHVVLTSGTSESYAHLFRILASPGERIAAPLPSSPLFEPLAAAEGIELIDLVCVNIYTFERTVARQEALAAGARAVIVVEPNADGVPRAGRARRTGSAVRAARRGDHSRRVFGDHAWPGQGPLPSALGERRVPTFVLSGLSKVCGMPQFKLGWIAACGPAAERDQSVEALAWIADLFLSVSTPVQLALPMLMEARHEFQRRMGERLRANLGVVAALVARRPELECLPAHGGWSAVLRLPTRLGAEAWALELLERGVVVHPGHFYDFEREAFLVISLIAGPFHAGLAPQTLLASA
jgi:aspartate/methionine/tyrosine aminotransferase